MQAISEVLHLDIILSKSKINEDVYAGRQDHFEGVTHLRDM